MSKVIISDQRVWENAWSKELNSTQNAHDANISGPFWNSKWVKIVAVKSAGAMDPVYMQVGRTALTCTLKSEL